MSKRTSITHTSSSWTHALAHPLAPVALVMLSDAAFTFMDGTAQLLDMRGIPIGEVVFGRMWINCLICFIFLLYRDPQTMIRLFDRKMYLVWVRALVATFELVTCYAAIYYVPLSIFMTLFHLRPFPTSFICWLVLSERSSMVLIVASVISFLSVILVVQPDFLFSSGLNEDRDPWQNFLGTTWSLLTMIIGASDILLCRMIGDAVDFMPLIFAYTLIGSLVAPLIAYATGEGFEMIYRPSSYIMMTSIASIGMVAQATYIKALQLASGPRVAVLGYFQILWAVLWQMVVHSNPPNLLQIVGTSIIIAVGSWAILKDRPDSVVKTADDAEAETPLVAVTSGGGCADGYEPVSMGESPVDTPRRGV